MPKELLRGRVRFWVAGPRPFGSVGTFCVSKSLFRCRKVTPYPQKYNLDLSPPWPGRGKSKLYFTWSPLGATLSMPTGPRDSAMAHLRTWRDIAMLMVGGHRKCICVWCGIWSWQLHVYLVWHLCCTLLPLVTYRVHVQFEHEQSMWSACSQASPSVAQGLVS